MQRKSDKSTKSEQIELEQRTDQGEKESRRFNHLRDLLRLTFRLNEQEKQNVYEAQPEQMTALAALYANVSEVDQTIWPVHDRLDFVNALYEFCEVNKFNFPLEIENEPKPETEPDETGSTLNSATDERGNKA